MNIKFWTISFWCISLCFALPARRDASPSVTVKNGTISGLHSSTYDQDFFLGVPFAQPPVENLRFRNPKSIDKAFSKTLKATEYAPECVGYGVSNDILILINGYLTLCREMTLAIPFQKIASVSELSKEKKRSMGWALEIAALTMVTLAVLDRHRSRLLFVRRHADILVS